MLSKKQRSPIAIPEEIPFEIEESYSSSSSINSSLNSSPISRIINTSDDETEELKDSSSGEEETEDEIEEPSSNSRNSLIHHSFEPLSHQASGHSQLYLIDKGKIAKPCNPHEANIYWKLTNELAIKPFTPKFYGIIRRKQNSLSVRNFQRAGEFIVLEDLTSGYKKPCILDLKLGRRNYIKQNDYSTQKKKWMDIKCTATTSAKLGFRLSGAQVYKPSLEKYAIRKSKFGNRLSESQVISALEFFLNDGIRTRYELLPFFISRLRKLVNALADTSHLDFVASSLLLIYEGECCSTTSRPTRSNSSTTLKQDVRLIDFDHTVVKDSNSLLQQDSSEVIFGIQTLIQIMSDLSKSCLQRRKSLYSFDGIIKEQKKQIREPSFRKSTSF